MIPAGHKASSFRRGLGGTASWIGLALRLGAVLAATGVLYAAHGIGVVALRGARRRRWRGSVLARWGRVCLWLFRVQLDVRGAPPQPPCLLVSNHVSYVDILVLAVLVRPVFVSAAELRSWPLVGLLARTAGTIFVERGRKRDLVDVNREIARRLAEGHALSFFPEGTNSDGRRVMAFKPALLEPAVAAALPVHYAAVSYRTEPPDPPASRSVCWTRGVPFAAHALRLARVRRVEAVVRFGEAPIAAADRKELARELQASVERIFTPLA